MKPSAVLVAIFVLIFMPAGINAQCLNNTLSNSEAGLDFASWLNADGDMNNDGYDDIAVEANGVDKVYVYSGKTLEIMYTIDVDLFNINGSPNVSMGGDVNNDGFDDLIVGTPSAPNGGVNIYSGSSGTLMRTLEGGEDGPNLGNAVDYAGDVNNDGYDDIIALDDITKVMVFSGKNGAVLYEFYNTIPHDLWGIMVGGLGDVNNDGYDDFFFSDAGSIMSQMYGWLYVISGENGDTLYVFSGENDGDVLGWKAFGPGDIDGDGCDDILASAMQKTTLFSGATGEIMHTFPDRARHFFDVGDVDKDGTIDLGISFDESGGQKSRVYSGSTFAEIFEAVGEIAAGGDLDQDGYTEILLRLPAVAEDTLTMVQIYKYGDTDCDGYSDLHDICPVIYNPDQEDHDGDGIGDSCDTCDEIEFALGTDIVFIKGTAPDGVSEIAEIPFQIRISSFLDDCYPSEIISDITVILRYDPYGLIFDSAYIGTGLWNGNLSYEVIPHGLYNTISLTLTGGSMALPPNPATCFYLDFEAECQHDLVENILDITTPSELSNNWVMLGAKYYVTKPKDGMVVAVMGENPCYTCGDFDMNAMLNILDVTSYVNYLYKGGPPPSVEFAADVDSSGGINLLDVTAIINYLYRGGPELNCP